MAKDQNPRHRNGDPDHDYSSRFDDSYDDLDDLDELLDEDFADVLRGEADEADIDALTALFPDAGYQIYDLGELAGVEDDAAMPTLTLDEALDHLRNKTSDLPLVEYVIFSYLSEHGAEKVRRAWPHLSVERRRTLTANLLQLFDERMDLFFGPLFRIALNDPDAVVRQQAIVGLAEDDEGDLMGRFVHMLETDESDDVRAAAAQALALYVLEGELDEFDPAQAARAEQALLAVLTNPAEPVEVQCRALESIAYSGDLGVRQLIEEAYYSPLEEKRVSALVAMGRSADVRWRRLARAELTNPSPAMRAQAAYACGELEAKSALPELLRLLRDPEQLVRLAAINALGRIGGPRAQQALEALIAGSDEVEAFAAEEALEEMTFYASVDAASIPIYEEVDTDEIDEDREDWFDEDEGEDDEDDDLGEYA
jgi:hypothetical protein